MGDSFVDICKALCLFLFCISFFLPMAAEAKELSGSRESSARTMHRSMTIRLTMQNKIAQKIDKESNISIFELQKIAADAFSCGQFEKAIRASRKVLSLDPDNEKALRLLADCYIHRNCYDSAIEILEVLTSKHPRRPDNYADLANLYIQQGDYNRASDCLDLALKHRAKPSHIAALRARICLVRGEIREAKKQAELALKANPNERSVALLYYCALLKTEGLEKAFELFKPYWNRYKEDREFEIVKLDSLMGMCSEQSSIVLLSLSQMHQEKPDDPYPMYYMIQAYDILKRSAELDASIRKFMEITVNPKYGKDYQSLKDKLLAEYWQDEKGRYHKFSDSRPKKTPQSQGDFDIPKLKNDLGISFQSIFYM